MIKSGMGTQARVGEIMGDSAKGIGASKAAGEPLKDTLKSENPALGASEMYPMEGGVGQTARG